MQPKEQQESTFSLHQIGTLSNHSYEIARIRFSLDGSLLASIEDGRKELQIWGLSAKTHVKTLTFDNWPIDFAFSPNGTDLAIMEANDTLSLWENTGEHCLDRLPIRGYEIAFLLEENKLITVEETGIVSFWDTHLRNMVFSFQAIPNGSEAVHLAVSPDISCLALTSSTQKVFLWLFDSFQHEAVHLATFEANIDEGIVFLFKRRSFCFLLYYIF